MALQLLPAPRLALIAASAFCLGSCGGVLDPQGPVGLAEKTLLLNALAIMLAIVVPVIVAVLGVAWWFRASNTRAFYWPNWEYSGRIELVVWSIPAMVVLLLGGIALVSSYRLDPGRPLPSRVKSIEVEVISLDWKWLFIYPEYGVASVNRIVAPVGTPVSFRLTSATVMNSFFVPQLGSQIYTMPGMATRLHLQADVAGRYPGLSAQFSGDGFSGMRFQYDAVSQDEFNRWIGQARSDGAVLDLDGYRQLRRASSDIRPYTYRSVVPGLFDAVVMDGAMPIDGASHPAPHAAPHAASHRANIKVES